MSLEKIETVKGRAVVISGDDVDTDRIIPARFMKCVTFDGLGQYLFHDVRFNADGSLKQHPLNDPQNSGASILVVGNNFGCGSSREHAPQAIYRGGYRAIIGLGFAEIFFGNSTTLGIPCVCVTPEVQKSLTQLLEAQPQCELTLDLVNQTIQVGEQSYPFTQKESARLGLVQGKWDAISDLIEGLPQVEKVANTLPYMAKI